MFVLMLSVKYEGEMLLGVYSSAQAAKEASENFIASQREGIPLSESESFVTLEVQLDAAARCC